MTDSRVLIKSFEPIYGQPCWRVIDDSQLGMSLNFGEPSLDIREPFKTDSTSERARQLAALRRITVHGQWWLWIYCCRWRLYRHGELLARDSSSLRRIELGLKQLDGQKLLSVQVHKTKGATDFEFDLGCQLSCVRFDDDLDRDLWVLYKPNGYVLSVNGRGLISHERGSTAKPKSMPRRPT